MESHLIASMLASLCSHHPACESRAFCTKHKRTAHLREALEALALFLTANLPDRSLCYVELFGKLRFPPTSGSPPEMKAAPAELKAL